MINSGVTNTLSVLLLGAILLLCTPALLKAQPSDSADPEILAYIRETFYVAVDEEATAYSLMEYIERTYPGSWKSYPPVVAGYYASLEGLKGRHSLNPLKKMRFVRNAIAYMDPLVAENPGNLEIRFLRFSFYQQIPAFFGVAQHVPEDLEITIRLLTEKDFSRAPLSVQLDMMLYILETDKPDEGQRRRLQELLLEPR